MYEELPQDVENELADFNANPYSRGRDDEPSHDPDQLLVEEMKKRYRYLKDLKWSLPKVNSAIGRKCAREMRDLRAKIRVIKKRIEEGVV